MTNNYRNIKDFQPLTPFDAKVKTSAAYSIGLDQDYVASLVQDYRDCGIFVLSS